jgi:sec-independent protein translocase protein TatA
VFLSRETVMFEGLFQPMHLVVILAIALLVFGPKKLPELGRGLGESIRGFKDALNGGAEASQAQASTPKAESPKPPVAPPAT